MNWVCLWQFLLADEFDYAEGYVRQSMGSAVCPQCVWNYRPGEVITMGIDRARMGTHLTPCAGYGIISHCLVDALGRELFENRFALGVLYGANGRPLPSHVTFNARHRKRVLRSGPKSGVWRCEVCNLITYVATPPAKVYLLEEDVRDEVLVASPLHQLIIRKDVFENANQGDRFNLARFARELPILKTPRDTVRTEVLYPNPEIRRRPDGSKVEIVYDGWVPVRGGAPRVPGPAAPLPAEPPAKAIVPPQEAWAGYESNPTPTLTFAPTPDPSATDRWPVACHHELAPGATATDFKQVEAALRCKLSTGVRELWARHNGARLFIAGEHGCGLELYPLARFARQTVDRRAWLVVGEVPRSGNLLLVQSGGAGRGAVACLDHETDAATPLYDSVGELLVSLARQPGDVIHGELGNFFRLRRDYGGDNIEWSPV